MEMINTCKTPTHMCVQELHIILEATWVHIITQMHVFLSPVVTSEQGFKLYYPHAMRKYITILKRLQSNIEREWLYIFLLVRELKGGVPLF